MTDQRSRDEALVAAAVLASLYYKTDDGGVLIHDNKRILSAARWALDMNTDIKSALAGEAKAGDDECAKGNHAWRGPLLGWWRCVLCGEKTGDAGHPSKTKLAALEAENARLRAELDQAGMANARADAHAEDLAWFTARFKDLRRALELPPDVNLTRQDKYTDLFNGIRQEMRIRREFMAERDAAVTQRDEFQRRMLEAEKDAAQAYENGRRNGLGKGQAERDALAAKVKEMEAECAQALDNATTARSAFSKMLDERDAVSDRARSLEHDLNLCESHRRRLQDQLSAIRAAAKE